MGTEGNGDRPTQQLHYDPAQMSSTATATQPPSFQTAPNPSEPPRRHIAAWLIAAIVVALVAAIVFSFITVRNNNRHAAALADCQSALADYCKAQKQLKQLTNDSAIVRPTGCSSDYSTENLQSSADILRNATTTLNAEITALKQHDDASTNSSQSSKNLEQSKKALQESIDAANALLDVAQQKVGDGTVGRIIVDALRTAIDSSNEVLNNSGIKDSKYYKAAKTTLDEAVTAVNDWIDQQAAKAE